MTARRREDVVAVGLGLAVLAQAVGLVARGGMGAAAAVQVLAVGVAAAAAVAATWRVRRRLNHRIDMLLVMLAAGGLGMLLGGLLDARLAATSGSHAMHHHAGSAWAMIPTWMTALMLAAAVPAALALTRCAELARTGWRRWVATHLVGNAAMVVAMVWVGHWLGPGLGRLAGSAAVGHHLAMLLGMTVGMELGMFAGEALLGLAPWREWRWREDWEGVLASASDSGFPISGKR